MSRREEDEVVSFLARWSRRKAAARRGLVEPEPGPPTIRQPAEPGPASAAPDEAARGGPAEPRHGAAEAPSQQPAAAALDELELARLPDPDTLDAASDFSVFMRPGVPAELRRRALRRLWRVNPIISTPDGLDDYYIVNDFSDASTVVADLKTLYRVGRGMVAAFEETAEAEAPAAEPSRRIAAEGAAAEPSAPIEATATETAEIEAAGIGAAGIGAAEAAPAPAEAAEPVASGRERGPLPLGRGGARKVGACSGLPGTGRPAG